MMNLSRAVVRSFATSGARRATAKPNEIEKGYFEIKKLQEHFQKNDGKPVFLKGSAFDNVLFGVTALLCLGGIGGMGKLFYELSVPKTE